MRRELNLTEGNIIKTLTRLALPIMGTSFIQMAYSLTDAMWLGRLSTKAVAAAGIGGFFLWLGAALIMITQIGVGVSVSQSYGKSDIKSAREYITAGLLIDIIIGLVYGFCLFTYNKQIIGFFNLGDLEVIGMAESYLQIIGMGIIFHFLNPVLSTTLNSSGDSMTPFKVNTIGLVANMILDPLLIFTFGLGIEGAAIATITSQMVVTMIFLVIGKRINSLYSTFKLFSIPDMDKVKKIIKLGFPPSTQMGIHAMISIVLTRIIAGYGPVAVAVQTIGSQIESISWMTSEGFAAAISAFVGQNYGANKISRIKEGYYKGIKVLGTFGIFASLLLIFAARPLFTIFTPDDPKAIAEGIIYLRILGLSQFFMSIEIGTAGAFNGLGKTIPPTITGISLNAMRIPAAILLSGYTFLELSGIWWAISGSSILKGIILFAWYQRELQKLKEA
ncbi:MATE family efflux transporter [Gudongella sp. DL1XJH-153]|uniref:MATE family efflux transporter n=1 Tax=Gudongella sp. DL1XJH-153 TaxID=3409804 RepID=UPI003BB6AADC